MVVLLGVLLAISVIGGFLLQGAAYEAGWQTGYNTGVHKRPGVKVVRR